MATGTDITTLPAGDWYPVQRTTQSAYSYGSCERCGGVIAPGAPVDRRGWKGGPADVSQHVVCPVEAPVSTVAYIISAETRDQLVDAIEALGRGVEKDGPPPRWTGDLLAILPHLKGAPEAPEPESADPVTAAKAEAANVAGRRVW